MKLPTRHIAISRGKYRNFYLLPVVWYPTSKKLCFRWPLRFKKPFSWAPKTNWQYYLWVNIKAFIFFPYMLWSNLYYFKETGFVYKEIDYDAIYGE